MAFTADRASATTQTMSQTVVVRNRGARPLGVRVVGGLLLLGFGSVVGFLSGAGAGAVYNRLVPERALIVSLIPRVSQHTFRLVTHHGVLAAIIDPRRVRIDLARGWTVEQTAFHDRDALLYFTGPFFEEEGGSGYDAKIIGDVYFYGQLTLADKDSRGFAARRYFMAITKGGRLHFGYGAWHDGYQNRYDVFVGGLGYLYAAEPPPPDYSNPYSGLTQRIHDVIPRERLVVGKDGDGHLVVIKTPPTTSQGAIHVARSLGLVEAYFLDQGNKARFIAPGQVDDRPRYNLPYLLRVAYRDKAWHPISGEVEQPRWPEAVYHSRRLWLERLRRLRLERERRERQAEADRALPMATPEAVQLATPAPDSDPFAN